MAKHLYVLKQDNAIPGSTPYFFGLKPGGKGTYQQFHDLDRKIGLKDDLGWGEVAQLQGMFRAAEIWPDFPAEGLQFVFAELQPGDEDQRIDLLYIRNDGGLYPCELKIGGTSLETHGQIIRYIADLHYQEINTKWLIERKCRYLKNRGAGNSTDLCIAEQEFRGFLSENGIEDRHIHLIRNSGILVDEEFKSQSLKAVRYLNELCGFSIRLLRLDAFVAQNWVLDRSEFRVRIDIVEVQ